MIPQRILYFQPSTPLYLGTKFLGGAGVGVGWGGAQKFVLQLHHAHPNMPANAVLRGACQRRPRLQPLVA